MRCITYLQVDEQQALRKDMNKLEKAYGNHSASIEGLEECLTKLMPAFSAMEAVSRARVYVVWMIGQGKLFRCLQFHCLDVLGNWLRQ